jgi:hypothetical protein
MTNIFNAWYHGMAPLDSSDKYQKTLPSEMLRLPTCAAVLMNGNGLCAGSSESAACPTWILRLGCVPSRLSYVQPIKDFAGKIPA